MPVCGAEVERFVYIGALADQGSDDGFTVERNYKLLRTASGLTRNGLQCDLCAIALITVSDPHRYSVRRLPLSQ
jgi:hypothetical protein